MRTAAMRMRASRIWRVSLWFAMLQEIVWRMLYVINNFVAGVGCGCLPPKPVVSITCCLLLRKCHMIGTSGESTAAGARGGAALRPARLRLRGRGGSAGGGHRARPRGRLHGRLSLPNPGGGGICSMCVYKKPYEEEKVPQRGGERGPDWAGVFRRDGLGPSYCPPTGRDALWEKQ